jgi:hypothetical protein
VRQRAAVSGFRINELNAAAPVLLTMTLRRLECRQ